jgi:ferredoxin
MASARYLPKIDPGRCTGCGRCIAACAPHVLVLERVGWDKQSQLVDVSACTGCHHCAWRCPFDAITMVKNTQAGSLESRLPSESTLSTTRQPGHPS